MKRHEGLFAGDGGWNAPDVTFIHTDYKNGNRLTRLLIEGEVRDSGGWRYRRITPEFDSPLVNDLNLALCGGWNLADPESGRWVTDRLIVEQVLSGRKPLGEVFFNGPRDADRPEWMPADWTRPQAMAKARALEAVAVGRGLSVRVSEADGANGGVFVCLSHRGTLGGLFDLDGLAGDYRGYLADVPKWAERVVGELTLARGVRLEEFAEGSRPFVGEPLPVCGLVLGYPIWSTAALVRQGLQVAQ